LKFSCTIPKNNGGFINVRGRNNSLMPFSKKQSDNGQDHFRIVIFVAFLYYAEPKLHHA
jgi:hypothetical protein